MQATDCPLADHLRGKRLRAIGACHLSKGRALQSVSARKVSHSRTREYPLVQRLKSGHILGPMAGSPLKRQRQLGVRAEDGSVIAFPRLTHPRAGLSHAAWRALGPALRRCLMASSNATLPVSATGPDLRRDDRRVRGALRNTGINPAPPTWGKSGRHRRSGRKLGPTSL
jgi:hypothetical protein